MYIVPSYYAVYYFYGMHRQEWLKWLFLSEDRMNDTELSMPSSTTNAMLPLEAQYHAHHNSE